MNGFNSLHNPLPLSGVVLVLIAHHAYALDPARSVNQYVEKRWDATNGLPRGRVNAISQSADGYLWISTERGLIRFDGQVFQRLQDGGHDQFALDHILGFAAERGGVSWIRSLDPSLIRYEDGKFVAARLKPAHDPLVTAMVPERDGSVLFASRLDGIFQSKDGSFQPLIARELLPYSAATSIAETPAHDVWLGTVDSGLVRIHNKKVVPVPGLPGPRVTALLTGSDEQVYIGTDRGLIRWNGSKLTSDGIPDTLRKLPIWAIVRDRDGNIWIGSDRGLIRLNSQGAATLNESASSKPVTAVFEDREGDIWAGSADQLLRMQESSFATYLPAVSPAWDQGGPVHPDSRGEIWVAPDRGVLVNIRNSEMIELRIPALQDDQIYSIAGNRENLWLGSKRQGLTHISVGPRNQAVTTYSQISGVPPHPIYTIHENYDGTIWIGTVAGGAAQIQNGKATTYTTRDGLASNTVFSISEGADGTMWFGTPSGLSSYLHGRWRTYHTDDGLPSANIYTTYVDKLGVVWAGTLNGLSYIRAGRAFTAHSDLSTPHSAILGVTEDRLGSLWLVTADSVRRVDRTKLLAGSLASGDVREFGHSDGLLDLQGVRRDSTIATDRSGTVWISRARGVVSVNPERVLPTAVPTIVHISQLLIDGNPRDFAGALDLHSDTRRVSIRYEGLNLSAPEGIRYRFRLDGFDQEWNQAGNNKEAVYTNLGPGSYRFRAVATNAHQVWNGSEAALSFTVVPAFWQTVWFGPACAITVIITAILAYRFRVYQLTENVKLQFEARFAERNRIARDLHDTLLQSFQGLLLRFQAVENMLPDKPMQARSSLAVAINHAARAITEGRDAVQELRRDEGGTTLVDILSSLGRELSLTIDDQNGPAYRVLMEGTPQKIHPRLQDDLYRISREAVANAFRHAQATHIELDIRYDPSMFRLRIRDDGVGMNPDIIAKGGRDGHWGLPGMQERAKAIHGQLEIWSQVNRGTEIELTVPANIAYMQVESGKMNKRNRGHQ